MEHLSNVYIYILCCSPAGEFNLSPHSFNLRARFQVQQFNERRFNDRAALAAENKMLLEPVVNGDDRDPRQLKVVTIGDGAVGKVAICN